MNYQQHRDGVSTFHKRSVERQSLTLRIVGMIFCFFSCGNLENPKERNTLVFSDSITSVTDSLSALNAILLNTQKDNYVYAIDSNCLYINNGEQTARKVGLLSDSLIFESKLLSFIATSDRKHFISLVTYLNRNYLSRCDIENNRPIYTYRADIYMADRQTDLFRYVFVANSEKEVDLNRYRILDNYRNIYLLADKEAKVWSSE